MRAAAQTTDDEPFLGNLGGDADRVQAIQPKDHGRETVLSLLHREAEPDCDGAFEEAGIRARQEERRVVREVAEARLRRQAARQRGPDSACWQVI